MEGELSLRVLTTVLGQLREIKTGFAADLLIENFALVKYLIEKLNINLSPGEE